MKFSRIGPVGAEIPAVLDGETWRDLSSVTDDINAEFLSSIKQVDWAQVVPTLPALNRARIGAPVARPGKVVCVGLNYSDHAAESGLPEPTEPVIFMKDPATVIGPEDVVLIPRGSVKTDWEVELAIIIGDTARYLADEAAALKCVAGYAISNDVSEREFQLERGGQWDKGKSCETFNPLGPVLVTPDEVEDPSSLTMQLWVNGHLRQAGNTADMIFSIGYIIHYLSQFMVLYPGDIINTGTPAGVAMGSRNEPYLRPGDVMRVSIEGLGEQRQEVEQA